MWLENLLYQVWLDALESERWDGSRCRGGRRRISRFPHREEHSQPRWQGGEDVMDKDGGQVADLVILGVEEAIIERNSKMHSTEKQHEIAKWVNGFL